jgi:hypothetical protein
MLGTPSNRFRCSRSLAACALILMIGCKTGASGGEPGTGGSSGGNVGSGGSRGGAGGSSSGSGGNAGGSTGSGGSGVSTGGSGGGYAGSGGSGGSSAGGAGGSSPGDGGGPTDSNSVGTGGTGGSGPRPDAPPADPNCMPSKHYGRTGEMWAPDGRFLDWGYAGYHTGMDPIPNVEGPIKMVTEFGAKGDDMVDDTDAFTQAVAMTNGVLLIPAGRYILTKQLFIRKSNFVLRGEGQGKTILYFPRPLTEVGVGGTSWSFNGGFITADGSDQGPVIGMVTANAPKGAQKLTVSATTGVQVGSWVRIIQTDKGGTLFRALYGGMHPGNVGEDGGTEVFRFYSKVTAVDAGSITLERHLPFQIDTNWTPTVRAVMPTVREIGVENLTLEMAPMRYQGHFNERGYNGIYYVGAHDSWVRNVTLINAELGISIYRSYFVTVTDVVLDSNVSGQAQIGHHGLNSARGADCWFTRFEFKQRYIHDLTVDGYAMGTVWSKGKGVNMNMDHHGRAPYGTLWTDLDLGTGNRAYDNGGAGNRLPPTASYTTSWNLRGSGAVDFPPSSYGPNMNFVGVGAGSGPAHWSIENIPRDKLCTPDLHEAMLNRRRYAAP